MSYNRKVLIANLPSSQVATYRRTVGNERDVVDFGNLQET